VKNISFRQPRYIIPLILLPFFFLFFFIFRHWNGSAQAAVVGQDTVATNQINPLMPGVAKQVTEEPVKDKFGAYQEAFKHNTDFTALENINAPTLSGPDGGLSSVYSPQDIAQLQAQKTLDSLQRVMRAGQSDIDQQMQAILQKKARRNDQGQATYPPSGRSQEEAFLAEVQRMNGTGASGNPMGNMRSSGTDNYTEQMMMFREQMKLVDSIQQANQRSATGLSRSGFEAVGKKGSLPLDPASDSSFTPLPVSLQPQVIDRSRSLGFHTLRNAGTSSMVIAMIDQDVKVNAGHRVRIRLLQDIYVGGTRVPKGTYLYAQVTGFQTSRINLSITQVFLNGQTLPVQLDVFDNDGYLGLYVPGSNFREFSKEIGTQATRGLSQLQTADQNDPVNSLINQLFQTGTSATTKMIRKEKAVLTYNYSIYLQEKQ
jgi:conjugative transposon TraM protein